MVSVFPSSVHSVQKELEDILDEHTHKFTLLRRKRLQESIARSANRHSLEIEETGGYPYFEAEQDEEVEQHLLRMHQDAWDYATDNINDDLSFDASDITLIADRLLPYQNLSRTTGFRKGHARIQGASHQPPNAGKVQDHMNELLRQVQGLETPLEKGIYAHFHIARIHPFDDGNGRTARIVQNAIMCEADMLPVPVYTDQRDFYIETLDSGVRDFYDGDKKYLRSFSELLVHNLWETIEGYKDRIF